MTKLFSIIIPYYQGTITDEEFNRCLTSLVNQTCKDFEVLIYHDGELTRQLSEETKSLIRKLNAPIKIITPRRNDWGHSLRNIGILESEGDYIIHMNPDNVLFNILGKLKEFIEVTQKEIYILPLKMMGMKSTEIAEGLLKLEYNEAGKRDYSNFTILKGIPKHGSIDAMQLIMKRVTWLIEGGWYDKRIDSDGYMYQTFCKKYLPTFVPLLMGEHY